MKQTKRFGIGLAAMLAGMMAMFTGCASTQVVTLPGVGAVQTDTNGVLFIGSTKVDPAAAGVAVQYAAKYGAQALLKQQPDSRQYLAISAGVISAAIASQTYDPGTLQTNLQTALTGSTSANNADAIAAGIADGLQLYTLFYGQVVNKQITDASPYLQPCLQGLVNGITQALNLTAPAPAAP